MQQNNHAVKFNSIYTANDLLQIAAKDFNRNTASENIKKLHNDWNQKNKSGVYIWGYQIEYENEKVFIPLYVGKHGYALKRVSDHFYSLHFGNKYQIFKDEVYKKFQDEKFQNSVISNTATIKIAPEHLIFSCELYVLKTLYGIKDIFFNNLNSKEITSQGFELMYYSNKPQIIQQTIEKYFSFEKFSFTYFLTGYRSNYEAALKFALKRNTLSGSNSSKFLKHLQLKLIAPPHIEKLFNLDSHHQLIYKEKN